MEKNMNRNLCRLEAGGDGRLYSVSFEAELTGEHVRGMLEAVRRSGDRGAASAAHAFLKRSGLGFSGFSAQEMFPEGRELMHMARAFLHGSREEADRLAGDAGRYFLCLDPLQREPDGSGAGCFLAARRAPEGEGFRWDVAGQEFCPGSPEECFSAVRIAGAGEDSSKVTPSINAPSAANSTRTPRAPVRRAARRRTKASGSSWVT